MARQFKPGQLQTGSLYNISSSYALTASYASNAGTTINTGSFVTISSFNAFTASYTTGSFTGSFKGDGSQLTGIVSSKWTGSNPISRQSDVEITGSLRIQGSITGSLFGTASNATTASYFNETDPIFVAKSGSFATTGSNTFIGTQTITGSNGRLIYTGTTSGVGSNPTLAEVHANDDFPWLHRFYNDTFSTSSAVMAYYGWNDGRFVFHNESTQSIGLQVNGFNAENGLLVYSDKVAFVNNAEVTGSLNVIGVITGSLFGTASWAENYNETDPVFTAISGTFATTGSNTFYGTQTINGDVTINGTASIAFLNVTYESASVIYSSGSNQFGDAINDVQTLIGRTIISGSLEVTGSANLPSITGSLFGTASWAQNAQTASYVLNAVSSSFATTASFATSASYAPDTTFPYTGSARITGSLVVTGSISSRVDSPSNSLWQTHFSGERFDGASLQGRVYIKTNYPFVEDFYIGKNNGTANNDTSTNGGIYYSHNGVFTVRNTQTSGFYGVTLNANQNLTQRVGIDSGNTSFNEGWSLRNFTNSTDYINFAHNSSRVGIGWNDKTTSLLAATLDVKAPGALSSDLAFRVRNSADTRDSFLVNGLGQARVRTTGFYGDKFFISYVSDTGVERDSFVFTSLVQNSMGRTWTFDAGYNGNFEGLQISNDLTGNDKGLFTIQLNNFCFGTNMLNSDTGTAERRVLRIANGVAPTTSKANEIKFYASSGSISGNSRPHFRTENGTTVWLGDESRLFNVTASRTIISSSQNTASGSSLTVYGSGSALPVFTVQGSQGELFSVTDSLSGSLFSVNDISGLPILEVFSDNTTLIGNYLDPMLITTAKITQTNSGSFTVYSLPTASYDTAFFEYSIKSGSNARAGTIMAIQAGSTINFTETTTTDIGNTSAVAFTVIVTGSNIALTGSSTTGAWTTKCIIRGV